MKSLIEILKNETQSLKEQYLKKTEEWATNYFEICKKRSTWKEVDWCTYLGIKPELKNSRLSESYQFYSFPTGFYNTKQAREYDRLKNEVRTIVEKGLKVYLEKQKGIAESHYEYSILKLAERIEKKGLNQKNLKVVTSHIGVNIETTLTDGVKTVRAWTIVAEGEVQRPHYRYLVK